MTRIYRVRIEWSIRYGGWEFTWLSEEPNGFVYGGWHHGCPPIQRETP